MWQNHEERVSKGRAIVVSHCAICGTEQLHLLPFDGFCLPQKQLRLPQAFAFDIPVKVLLTTRNLPQQADAIKIACGAQQALEFGPPVVPFRAVGLIPDSHL